jgi:hypothetical protein
MINLIAQNSENIGNSLKGIGPFGLENADANTSPVTFQTILSNIIGVITIIGFIWFIFLVITGAIGIMSAGGDKNALEGARKKLTSGLIGLIVLIAAIFIIDLIGTLLGVPGILGIAGLITSNKLSIP